MRRVRTIFAGLVLLPGTVWAAGPFMPTGYWETWPEVHDQAVVALTFDDGPNPVYTPQVLDILRAYDVQATFFVTGASVLRYPEIARQIVAQGNEIANHSMKHQPKLQFLLPHQILRDYRATQDAIYEATGVRSGLYRPPHGRISPWLGLTLRRSGVSIIGWNVCPKDWQNPPVEVLVPRVLERVKPGSIILLHDGLNLNQKADRHVLVQALPRLIEQLQRRGYRFVGVSELIGSIPRATNTLSTDFLLLAWAAERKDMTWSSFYTIMDFTAGKGGHNIGKI